MTLLEESMVILADTCKGHGADLVIEDWAKPFKKHLKSVHSLILFIINHGDIYAIFISFADVLALLLPAETRFATEIICARSLQKDKEQVAAPAALLGVLPSLLGVPPSLCAPLAPTFCSLLAPGGAQTLRRCAV